MDESFRLLSGDERRSEDAESKETASSSVSRPRQLIFVAVLFIESTVMFICNSCNGPFFPQVAAQRKGSPADTEVGISFGSTQLALATGSVVFGTYMNRLGAGFLLVSGTVLVGGSTVLFGVLADVYAWAPFIGLSVAINFVIGFGIAAFYTTAYSVVVSMFSSRTGTGWGVFSMTSSLGILIGPPLGGFLYDREGFLFPFAICGSVSLLFVPLLLILRPVWNALSIQTESNSQALMWSLVKAIPTCVLMDCLSQFVSFSAMGLIQTSLPVFLHNTFGWSASHISLVYVIIGVVSLGSSIVIGVLVDATKPRVIMIIGLFVVGCSTMMLGPSFLFSSVSPEPWLLYVSTALYGLGFSMVVISVPTSIINTAVSRGYENDNLLIGTVAGLTNGSMYLSGVVWAPVSGALTAAFGFRQSTTYIAFVVFLQAFVLIVSTVAETVWCRQQQAV